MNSLNSFSVDAGMGIGIERVKRREEVKTDASRVYKLGVCSLEAGVAFRLIDGRTIVFVLEIVELLGQKNPCKS